MCLARVWVSVPGVPPRTDVVCHPVVQDTPEGHDTALKGAVAAAPKWVFRSFSNRFGNSLFGEAVGDGIRPILREALLGWAVVWASPTPAPVRR
ncbi:hypothetical protein HRbin23_01255 [bacterium HR23]|nr:hypothetical protein HRbin23_01255 [bacterium HR23]